MDDSALTRFFGVAAKLQTWLGVLFHLLAFPLGLFYFVFLVVGLSLGVGLVVIWIGIPILLVVAGAWWLFGAFERLQARHLLGADVPSAPREWEKVDGVWAKFKAHFGSGTTWKDLAYLIAKLLFGTISFTLLVTLFAMVGWFLAMPVLAVFDVPAVNGTWVPPVWFGILCIPLGVVWFLVSLHVINAWSWVCRRWAEVMFRVPGAVSMPVATPPAAAPPAPMPAPVAPLAPTPERPSPTTPPAVDAPPAPPADDEKTS